MNKVIIYALLIFVSIIGYVSAQVEVSGLIDFEVSKGGKDSNYGVNEIAADYKDAHLAINQVNLFLFSQISESFSINARVQFDTWGTGKLNPIRLSLAELSWEPPEGSLGISVGRFVNPFGLYPQRQLSINNPVINTPLVYSYTINMSDRRGFLISDSSSTGYSYGYGYDSENLSTISYAGYSTGFMARWLIVPELLNLDIALTNMAPASSKNFTNLNNRAVIGRLSVQPAIFWQQGISFSYGSFMEKDTFGLNNMEKYRQTLIGTDWVIAYTYFELSGEFIYAMWKVPGYDQNGVRFDSWGNPVEFDLENYSFYIDLKYELPFIPGSYVVARYEELRFKEFDQPYGTAEITKNPWGNNMRRYTLGMGYKFSPDVLLKIAFSDQRIIEEDLSSSSYSYGYSSPDPTPALYQPKAYTLRAMLSASF